MKRRIFIWILVPVIAIIVAGFYRLRLDVDIFDLLPGDSRIAQGLKLYQNNFGTSREMIISVHSQEADMAESAVRSISETIEKEPFISGVVWQNPLAGNKDEMAEFFAYYWFNQAPTEFSTLAENMQGSHLEQQLINTKERMASSYQPEEIARLSNDPLALTQISSETLSSVLRSNQNPFSSKSGEFRIMFVRPSFQTGGFWTYRRFLHELQDTVSRWKEQTPYSNDVTVRITGTPAFIVQTGSGLLSDILMSVSGTLLLVSVLFWLVHRRWRPLIWMVFLLSCTILITIGLWGLFMRSIHAVSLGFAAILLGLTADYGLILYQEYLADPDRSVREHRSAVAPSIMWASITTSAAFLIIGRSSLPGLKQLGLLVGSGILVAAVIMMRFFLVRMTIGEISEKQKRTSLNQRWTAWTPGHQTVWAVTALLIGLSILVLSHRLPAVDYSTQNLGPKENRVQEAMEEIQREIGSRGGGYWIIVSGADYHQAGERLQQNKLILDAAVKQGLLKDYALPLPIWPHPEFQEANRKLARRLAGSYPLIKQAALKEGFTEDSLNLDKMILDDWGEFASQEGVVFPMQPGLKWIMRQFAGQASGQKLALGRMTPAHDVSKQQLLELGRDIYSETGGYLVAWPLLSESLIGLIKRDMIRVLLPIVAVVLILLTIAFRRTGEILLSLATIGISILTLLALMALFGWSWNLMNLMALPLLFGAGVDYSIHIQFGLRRYNGSLTDVRRAVGKAVLLCGASTASGFGTLAFASNTGVASLGRVCAAGILIITLVSIFLLPVWWQKLTGRKT